VATAIRVKTQVQAGGKIEITEAQLPEGEGVDVLIFVVPTPGSRPSILDVLADAPGHLAFQTAAEVDAYVRQEREEWEL